MVGFLPEKATYSQKNAAMIPRRPGPSATGSFNHPGGVSQTKDRIAMTMRSYCHVARSNVQKSACQIMRNGRVRTSESVMLRALGCLFEVHAK